VVDLLRLREHWSSHLHQIFALMHILFFLFPCYAINNHSYRKTLFVSVQVSFPNRTYIRKNPAVSLCVIDIVDTPRATAGYVPQKWRFARTSDLVSIWHSSSDSSEFRVTGVSLSFELLVSCATVMIRQRVRFDSDPIIRWLRCRWMTYESVQNIVHITKT
jgi:hypothetical protein